MKPQEFIELVSDGKIFTVTFEKKDKSIRVMNCRTGVKKHLKGGELKFNPIERNLLPVYDIQKQGYRMINMDTLIEVKIHNKVINLDEEVAS